MKKEMNVYFCVLYDRGNRQTHSGLIEIIPRK